MILLDTNVISQTMKPGGDSSVRAWLDAQNFHELFICAPVLGELYFGALNLPQGRKRAALLAACEKIEREFDGRILSYDWRAAYRYGAFRVIRYGEGRGIAEMDMVIAAIADVHHMAVATRNIRDFEGFGLPLINPFEPA